MINLNVFVCANYIILRNRMKCMNRYFIKLAYWGAAYHGWQMQKNAVTVQQVLEEALGIMFGTKILVTGAGRTDTGVHAKDFYAHFDLNKAFPQKELDKIVFKLNGYLPNDIYIDKIFPVSPEAHARFDALSRTYHYTITSRKDPFSTNSAWLVYGDIDMELMNEGANLLFNFNDFTSFSKLHTDVKTNNCTIMEASWEKQDHLLVFHIKADRFLRNMVRAIVGTLIDLGKGRIDLEDIPRIIEAKDRSEAGMSVPAHGLCLTKIHYPPKTLKL